MTVQNSIGTIITSWVAYTPTFTGFGTATSIQFWSRRVGDVLQVRGRFTSGTPTTTEGRITIGYKGTSANVSSDATVVTTIQICGHLAYSSTGAALCVPLIESNVSYITIGAGNATRAPLTKVNADFLVLSGDTVSVWVQIPVTTWP